MLPESEQTLIIRTDFSDDAAWDRLCRAIRTPSTGFGFLANVEFVNDRQHDGAAVETLVTMAPESQVLLFVADRVTLSSPDQPVLAVYLFDTPFQFLRVIPSELWGIENNISLGNMDFEEFVQNAGPDGIFRGF